MQQIASTYLALNVIARNMGISGTRLTGGFPNLTQLAPLYIDPVVTTKALGRTYVLPCAIGSNDGAIDGYSTVNDYADAVGSFIQGRKILGYDKTIICALIPRDDSTMTEPHRQAYNTRISTPAFLSSWSIDAFANLCVNPIMNDVASCSNPLYYDSDKVHPTALGSSLMFPGFTAAMTQLGLPA